MVEFCTESKGTEEEVVSSTLGEGKYRTFYRVSNSWSWPRKIRKDSPSLQSWRK